MVFYLLNNKLRSYSNELSSENNSQQDLHFITPVSLSIRSSSSHLQALQSQGWNVQQSQ
jgi:hypothetical protein